MIHQNVQDIECHSPTVTYYGRVRSTFGKDLPRIQRGSILDVGSSTGETTQELSEIYPNSIAIGCDINVECVEKAIIRNKNLILNLDGLTANFPDHFFDAVFCMNMLYYDLDNLTPDQLRNRLQNVRRYTKDYGYLLISGRNQLLSLPEEFINDHLILQFQGKNIKLTSAFIFGDKSEERARKILESLIQ